MTGVRARSTIKCDACQARRAQEGLRICRSCEQDTRRLLDRQAELRTELMITLARQDRLDPAPEAGRSANQPLPYSPPAAAALRRQRRLLWDWVGLVAEPEDVMPRPTVDGYAGWLKARMSIIRARDDAGRFVAGVRSVTEAAMRAVDHPLMRAVVIGGCPEAGCAGQVSVFIPMDGSDRAAYMRCDRCRTEFPSRDWHKLAASIQRRPVMAAC
jgi:hypothetical protein